MIKNIFKKQVVAFLVVLASFSALVVNAQESEVVIIDTSFEVCDHNHDGLRDSLDRDIYLMFDDTFDANGDGYHDQSDIDAYNLHWFDDSFCWSDDFRFIAEPPVVISETLTICDHNNDDVRDLTDVGIFAACRDTFDADDNGIHNGADFTAYQANYSNDDWCLYDFKCIARPEEVIQETLPVCDHNNDGVRNLTDVGMLASCRGQGILDADNDDDQDINDADLYAEHYNDDVWCRTNLPECNFSYQPENVAGTSSAGSNPPDLLNVKVDVSCEESVISWDTSKDSLTWLLYGEDTNYGQEYKSGDYLFNHSFTIKDLNPNTDYHYIINTQGVDGQKKVDYDRIFTTLSDEQCSLVLGEKIEEPILPEPLEPEVLGVQEVTKLKESLCQLDQDVLGQTQWAEGSLIRGCDMKIYHIENQRKNHVKSLDELFKYIGQRIYNVSDDIISLFE